VKNSNNTYSEQVRMDPAALDAADLEFMAECADSYPDQLTDCEEALQAAYDALRTDSTPEEITEARELFTNLLRTLNAAGIVCVA
jgi:hypothetical protein